MTLLILGGTGTLGSQIVQEALKNGYQVRCLVRNLKKAKFLREWGADLIKADLAKPETLTGTLDGIKAIIDASAARPSDPNTFEKVDLIGKENLIKAAEVAKIQHFISFSLIYDEQHLEISSIKMKYLVEETLKKSRLNYTIFQIPGFFQGLISQYGIPLLEGNPILVTSEKSAIPYISTEDVAKVSIKALALSKTKKKVFKIGGIKAWTSKEIIALCEKLSGQKAEIRVFPIISIKIIKSLASFFEWTWPIANRLAFIEVLNDLDFQVKNTNEFYEIFQIGDNDFSSLEDFFKEYFENMLKDLQKLNFQKSKDIIF